MILVRRGIVITGALLHIGMSFAEEIRLLFLGFTDRGMEGRCPVASLQLC